MEFGRVFNAARQAQGFRSQAHLDAFYASYDHGKSCTDCQPSMFWMDGDASWQPCTIPCPEAQRLSRASMLEGSK